MEGQTEVHIKKKHQPTLKREKKRGRRKREEEH